jgi:hypothetical protein
MDFIFEGKVEGKLKFCELWVLFVQCCLGSCLSRFDGVFRPGVPVDPAAHLLQAFAGGLPALLAMTALLLVESVNQTDPQSTAKQDAKNGNNDAVCPWAAVFRVIKAGTAVGCFVIRHERTRERAHARQYAVGGMPCQRFFFDLPFFFSCLGLLLTLATVS